MSEWKDCPICDSADSLVDHDDGLLMHSECLACGECLVNDEQSKVNKERAIQRRKAGVPAPLTKDALLSTVHKVLLCGGPRGTLTGEDLDDPELSRPWLEYILSLDPQCNVDINGPTHTKAVNAAAIHLVRSLKPFLTDL